MKKLSGLSALVLVIAMLFTAAPLNVSAETEWEDIVIADFSVSGGADNWKGNPTTYLHSQNMQSEITRFGKNSALRWCDETGYYRLRGADAAKFDNISKLINSYLNIWLYSTSDDGKVIDLTVYDSTTSKSKAISKAIKLDWTGWKLCSINVSESGFAVSDFNSATKTALDSDKANIHFQYNNSYSGTVTYVDSIWLSKNAPAPDSAAAPLTFDCENEASGISVDNKIFTFTANAVFAQHNYDSLIAITENTAAGTKTLSVGADYTTYAEFNKLYILFTNKLKYDASYTITAMAGITEAVTENFTTVFSTKAWFDDLIVLDMSKDGSFGKCSGSNGYSYINDHTEEIKRAGKDYSLKWYNFDSTLGTTRLRIKDSRTTNIYLKDLLKYDYLNIWIYSDNANGQKLHFSITDSTVNKSYNFLEAITVDYTGWKLFSIDISELTVASFDNATTGKQASENDVIYEQLQSNGWSIETYTDTVLYLDSVYLSVEKPQADEDAPEIGFEIENGSSGILPNKRAFAFTANTNFEIGKNLYNNAPITVKEGEETLSFGTDYDIWQEMDKLYVVFKNNLKENTSYTITQTEKNVGATFTTGELVSYNIDSCDFSYLGHSVKDAAQLYALENAALPEEKGENTLTAEAMLRNNSTSDFNAVLIICVRKNDEIIATSLTTPEIVPVGKAKYFTADIKADSYEECVIDAYCWDMTTMFPYEMPRGLK